MHPKPYARKLRLWGLVLVAGLTGAVVYAQPNGNGQPMGQPPAGQPGGKLDPKNDVVKTTKSGDKLLPVGRQLFLDEEIPAGVVEVLVGREDVLGVTLPREFPGRPILFGRNPGVSKLTFVIKDKGRITYDVVVQADLDYLRYVIRQAVPTANVDVTPGISVNTVILTGYVTSPQDADIVLRLAGSAIGNMPQNVINAMQIGGVQQVQIDVVIATVDRNEVRTRGFDFFINGKTFQLNSIVSGLIGSQPLGIVNPTSITVSPNANLQVGIAPAQFFGALQALRTEGVAKFLAEPKIVTQTGRPASFLAGGQQAVLGPSSGINGPGVQFQQVGVIMEVLPIVYGNGQIWLEINPINRQVNQGFGITTVFGAVPGFTEQNVRCSVMMESGQTFAIGGLIQTSIQGSTAKIPVLGDLPYIGTVFSQIHYEDRESELVILVTPRLVHPMDCNQVPRRLPGRETRTPDDYELFLENVMEAPRGQRKVWNGRCYNAPYKCDPSFANFPCVGGVCNGPSGLIGGAYGPAGCQGGAGCSAAPIPPALPPAPTPTPMPGQLPANLPTVQGAPVGPAQDTGAVNLPIAPLPPVIVVPPEAPRN
jgi:pilus assembly protein CpaC